MSAPLAHGTTRPAVPYETLPGLGTLLRYRAALEAVTSGEIDRMAEDARQDLQGALRELGGYLEAVTVEEIDGLGAMQH